MAKEPKDPKDGGAEAAVPPADLLERLTAALESLSARPQKSTDDATAMQALAAAVEQMTSGHIAGSKLIAEATRRAHRPSNEIAPMISVYNLRGDKDFPKPPLRCDMFMPWPLEPESLTREETELLNLLVPGEFPVERNDCSKIVLTVRTTFKLDSTTPDKLFINHDTAFNNDNHRLMPPLRRLLRQVLDQGANALAGRQVLSMEAEAALIHAGKLNDGTIPDNRQVVSVGA